MGYIARSEGLTILNFLLILISIGVAVADDSQLNLPGNRIEIVADDWCPYNCSPESNKPGFVVELVREIFKEHEITVIYTVLPWSRALAETRNGKFNAIIGATIDEAEDFVFPTAPVALSGAEFFIRSDSNFNYKNIDSLKLITLGAIQSYSYSPEVDRYLEKYKATPGRIEFSTGEDALSKVISKLLAGRLEVVVEDPLVMRHYLSMNGNQSKIKSAGIAETSPVYLGFAPNLKVSKLLAEKLTDGINNFEKSGQLLVIRKKYGL